MIIEQTVEIPSDHRLIINVPREIPIGKAWVELKLTPVVERESEFAPKPALSTTTPRANRLLGAAAGLGDISHEEIRAERLSKYLK